MWNMPLGIQHPSRRLLPSTAGQQEEPRQESTLTELWNI
jgi:hypothetical protein